MQYRLIYSENYLTNIIQILLYRLRLVRHYLENCFLIWNIPTRIEKSLIRLYRLFLNIICLSVKFILVVYDKLIKLSKTYNFLIAILLWLVDLCVIGILQSNSFTFEILINIIAILAISFICKAHDFYMALFEVILIRLSIIFQFWLTIKTQILLLKESTLLLKKVSFLV